jgi:hypothetical protein
VRFLDLIFLVSITGIVATIVLVVVLLLIPVLVAEKDAVKFVGMDI